MFIQRVLHVNRSYIFFFFFSSRRRHTRLQGDWSSDVCSSDLRKSGKNDANDAEAICEAVSRPSMRFVGIKSEEQQAVLMMHRVRTLVVANRTALANQVRGLLGEFGIVVPVGIRRLRAQLPQILEDAENGLPALARRILADLLQQLHHLDEQVEHYRSEERRVGKEGR